MVFLYTFIVNETIFLIEVRVYGVVYLFLFFHLMLNTIQLLL